MKIELLHWRGPSVIKRPCVAVGESTRVTVRQPGFMVAREKGFPVEYCQVETMSIQTWSQAQALDQELGGTLYRDVWRTYEALPQVGVFRVGPIEPESAP